VVVSCGGGVRRGTAADAPVVVEVAAGDHDRHGAVVSMSLPESLRKHQHFTLTDIEGGRTTPVQVDRGTGQRAWWILQGKLEAGKSRRYRLTPADAAPADAVRVEDNGKQLEVKVAGKPVLHYQHAVAMPPNPNEPYYARSGYLHPVYSPAGQVVTDDFNQEHPHQHGIMFAWKETTFEGRWTNTWDQKDGGGKLEHVKTDEFGNGPVFGFLATRLRHYDLTAPVGPKALLNERWRVRIFNVTDYFLFDIESVQTCASKSPVVVNKCFYGGMAIRGHSSWLESPDWKGEHKYEFLPTRASHARGTACRPDGWTCTARSTGR
jgi:hypothetical protein